ncbi:hypothetical protein PN498_09135 [Oscillatoria sp. CS-180]|uniref:hypothetical protein n=1 Tax=Oscillatoria sp. CS-180 TaxID=3021720 RepID=UPI00232CC386|nr:hypothetical protein [Oscillatoria sp. CS-180]MDB9526147.1 hypothetical protein [Oscillatoria sp. CS-180]
MSETSKSTISTALDIATIAENLDELHPLNFRLAFGLTHDEAAAELCIEPQTMRAYSKNKPSKRVKKLAATTTKRWISEKRPVNIEYLLVSK